MKTTLIFLSLLVTQLTFAQTLKEQRQKKEMLERVELLLEKVEQTRQEIDNQDIAKACKLVKEIFLLYPDHLKGIAGNLEINRRTSKAGEDALFRLAFIHKQSLICDQGKDHENVNPSALDKDLKRMRRALRKQRRIIKRSDAGQSNTFRYEYEF